MRIPSVACLLGLLVTLLSCSEDKNHSDQPYVILISFDGFRYDYAEKFGAKNIIEFAQKGVRAERMIPAFPSKTFPNHYTLVTGLYPDHHGIVANAFYDRKRNIWYEVGAPSMYDSSLYGGKPLWLLANKQNIISASYFWPGSEVAIDGIRPEYFKKYDEKVPGEDRFGQVIEWLKLPEKDRPHFISLYFSLIDNMGHRYGPESVETREAVLTMDSLFGIFIDDLNNLEIATNVVLVSDHGMSPVKYGAVLPEIADLEGCLISDSYPPMIYCADTSKVEQVYKSLRSDDRIEVYRKNEVPDHLHYGYHEMVGDLVCLSTSPVILLDEPRRVYGGNHGFDPTRDINMSAFFAASGPAFKSGIEIGPFENIHIYPMLAEILDLSIQDSIDGRIEVLAPILK
ncbi:ectonucleotide pyrophosphatase/phosphodiesterase [Marinoscillum sp. MHG1-6]|uniref:alkaline phosphatase family protein n=1 Tax=Marinoscillum sp. MHG1-6 TaxID=2959627 RepID=UPI002157B58B|nr:ectonucleotide pyrophosphatase/phosphodiesterase [Marinoscillum sp. MHG1-6]